MRDVAPEAIGSVATATLDAHGEMLVPQRGWVHPPAIGMGDRTGRWAGTTKALEDHGTLILAVSRKQSRVRALALAARTRSRPLFAGYATGPGTRWRRRRCAGAQTCWYCELVDRSAGASGTAGRFVLRSSIQS